jgi:hypothetical protein
VGSTLVCWYVGILVCWYVGILVCWYVGILVCGYFGILVFWYVGNLVFGYFEKNPKVITGFINTRNLSLRREMPVGQRDVFCLVFSLWSLVVSC